MKHALALLLLSCVLVAQDKPAAEAPKPAAVEKATETKPKIPPINVRDELIELIHLLKEGASSNPSHPSLMLPPDRLTVAAAMYDAELKAKTEAQRLLLQALVELSKEAAKPTDVQRHSSAQRPRW
jgi:hypothetical protein